MEKMHGQFESLRQVVQADVDAWNCACSCAYASLELKLSRQYVVEEQLHIDKCCEILIVRLYNTVALQKHYRYVVMREAPKSHSSTSTILAPLLAFCIAFPFCEP